MKPHLSDTLALVSVAAGTVGTMYKHVLDGIPVILQVATFAIWAYITIRRYQSDKRRHGTKNDRRKGE